MRLCPSRNGSTSKAANQIVTVRRKHANNASRDHANDIITHGFGGTDYGSLWKHSSGTELTRLLKLFCVNTRRADGKSTAD
ncbi:hypothetical protein F2P81_000988 [Scophthalmus maximus]|uniref:Uncharacterized protein n=1 Tax=Scophthalmus maximus TaxID=52904 RepID=A0A6A4TPY1_SCOMX|nr:hypothetical protein F2P81_000988 [Scophthalmus maximus]